MGGIVATVIVAGLGLFVLNFIKDAAFEVGSQVEERGDRIRQATDGDSAKSKKGSLKYDGTRYAPWMVIDEDGVEARKKERLERIKKEKKKGPLGSAHLRLRVGLWCHRVGCVMHGHSTKL